MRLRAASLITTGEVVSCGRGYGPVDGSTREGAAGGQGEGASSSGIPGPRPYVLEQWIVARDGWRCVNDRIEIDAHGRYAPTHLDSPSHFAMAADGESGVFARPLGAPGEGAAAVGPVIGRGVLIDVPRARGVDSLEPGDVVSAEEVQGALRAAGVIVGEGDILVFRFGPRAME